MTEIFRTRDVIALLDSYHPTPRGMYWAVSVPGSKVYVGYQAQGFLALFLPAAGSRRGTSMRAGVVSLSLNTRCVLHVDGCERIESRFHILQCESHDPSTVSTFAVLLDAFLLALPHAEATWTDKLTVLFRQLIQLLGVEPRADLAHARQGLWGELCAMAYLGGATQWSKWWHRTPNAPFDFTLGHLHLEVKSTLGPARSHVFSHRQLCPVGEERIAVLSLLLDPSPDGTSLQSLIQQARTDLLSMPSQLVKLETSVRKAGMSDTSVEGPCFSLSAAYAKLAVFDVSYIPRFLQQEPPGVSQTHYTVDLTATTPMSEPEVEQWLSAWLSAER